MTVAVGLRAHSGWAVAVTAAGTFDNPRILERRRILLADPKVTGSRQPYHRAAELPSSEAAMLIQSAIESSRTLALESLSAIAGTLKSDGYDIAGCGLLCGSGKEAPELKNILASHALIHAAEGEMFRSALAWAARECGLPVLAVREKSISIASCGAVNLLGKVIGSPWTQDQKYATIAALTLLAA